MNTRLLPTLLAVLAFTSAGHSAERMALVIGNGEYAKEGRFSHLPNPPKDAALVASSLEAAGFKVVLIKDAKKSEMSLRLGEFADNIDPGGVALFYYAGHGVQHNGKNYLMGCNAKFLRKYELGEEAIEADTVLAAMSERKPKTAMVFLDCCREPPDKTWLESDKRGVGMRGLAQMNHPDVVIAYAAAPEQPALDGDGLANSPFATALSKRMLTGEELGRVLKGVAADVYEMTKHEQRPWWNGSLLEDFFFTKTGSAQPVALSKASPTPSMSDAELQKRIEEEVRKRMSASVPISPAATTPSSSAKAGDLTQITLPGGVEMKFCYCPAGSFTMGSPKSEAGRRDDEGQVRVRLTQGFWMAQTECTQRQWTAVMGNNPSSFRGNELPVEMLSWEDVQGFLSKGNSGATLPGGYRLALPSEAQWEYACRAGTESVFSFGDVLNGRQANCDGTTPYGTTIKGTYLEKTCAVASYAANPWGLYDLHGNVWEWCADWYEANLPGGSDPRGAMNGAYRVYRGGSWFRDAALCRAAFRGDLVPGFRGNLLGFRPALVPSR